MKSAKGKSMIQPKNKHFGIDKSESKMMYGRKLYRVVALAALTLMGGDTVQEGAKGGWCSEQSIVKDRVVWLPEGGTFWGGTFEGGTFWGGTFEGGTFRGGTFRGGTFRGGTFWGGTFRGSTFEGGAFRGGTSTEKQPIFIGGMTWEITITDKHMSIGCQCHSLADWWQFDDVAIKRMDVRHALPFWQANKSTLMAICAATGREVERPACS